MPYSKLVVSGLFELRIRGKQEVRLLYAFNKNSAVILHGFTKKSNKLPTKEFETALKRKALLDSI
jgi:phage-related protein